MSKIKDQQALMARAGELLYGPRWMTSLRFELGESDRWMHRAVATDPMAVLKLDHVKTMQRLVDERLRDLQVFQAVLSKAAKQAAAE